MSSKAFRIHALPAGEGDALWIEWGTETAPHRMLVDMGRSRHGKIIHSHIDALPPNQKKIELMVMTHVERDHIEGALNFFEKGVPNGATFKDIWFNDWAHLHGLKHSDKNAPKYKLPSPPEASSITTRGALQGEKFKAWLNLTGQNWNRQFDDGPVMRPKKNLNDPIELSGGLKVTVLGPTQEILCEFKTDWAKEIQKAMDSGRSDIPDHVFSRSGIRSIIFRHARGKARPNLDTMADLKALAAKNTKTDHSGANRSSISLLLEYGSKRVLLAGDAHPADIIEAVNLLPKEKRKFDLVKLPHHGSEKNVSEDLIKALDCERFLISTSGSYFKHPDATAIARIIAHKERPKIYFNVPSTYNRWWDDPDWKRKFGYQSMYGTKADGIEVRV